MGKKARTSEEVTATARFLQLMSQECRNPDEEVRFLKRHVADALADGVDVEEAVEDDPDLTVPSVAAQAKAAQEGRMAALVRLLRLRGVTVSSSDKKIFSGGPATAKDSPDRDGDPVGAGGKDLKGTIDG